MSNKHRKKELSSRKLEANRHNAQQSTGPKSVEGKQRSSSNSYKHGVFADRLFGNPKQPAIDREQYEHLYAGFMEHYDPIGFMENLLVEKIATESLRQTRLLGYEQILLAYSASFETKSIGNLIRYDSALGRKLEKAIEQLEKLQAQRVARSNESEVNCEPEIEVPDIPDTDKGAGDQMTGELPNKLKPEACQPMVSVASEGNDCEQAISISLEPIGTSTTVNEGEDPNESVLRSSGHDLEHEELSYRNYETNPTGPSGLTGAGEPGSRDGCRT
jgi:hypothetical protein